MKQFTAYADEVCVATVCNYYMVTIEGVGFLQSQVPLINCVGLNFIDCYHIIIYNF